MKRNFAYLAGILLMLVALYVSQTGDVSFVPPAPEVSAATVALSGYAWSDNIGWISFSGAGYGVTLESNATGAPMPLSGYAWSDNIGWIKFGGLTAPPVGTNSDARIEGNNLLGWARACAVFAAGCSGALKPSADLGGWDGWISLSNLNGGGGTYGVTVGIGTFSSYAWGSDVIGWIDFSGVSFTSPCAPDATLQCTAGDPSLGIDGQDQWCAMSTSLCVSGTQCVEDAGGNPSCETVNPVGSLLPEGQRVRKETSASFNWNVANIGRCEIRGSNGDVLVIASTTPQPLASSALTNETTFELYCQDEVMNPEILLDTEIIKVLPTIEQF